MRSPKTATRIPANASTRARRRPASTASVVSGGCARAASGHGCRRIQETAPIRLSATAAAPWSDRSARSPYPVRTSTPCAPTAVPAAMSCARSPTTNERPRSRSMIGRRPPEQPRLRLPAIARLPVRRDRRVGMMRTEIESVDARAAGRERVGERPMRRLDERFVEEPARDARPGSSPRSPRSPARLSSRTASTL